MKVALYVRVSTKEQAEEGYSVGAQIEKLRKYCEAKSWDIYKEYIDAGFSGGKLERPAMNNLLHDANKKRFDMVLVYKLDRLSRSQKDTLYLIEDKFKPNGIDFSSMQENFDTSTPLGMAMVGILSVFAQLERAQITERMAMGREARAKEGLWHGGGYDPIGYDYIDGKLIINDNEAIQIKKIFDMYEAGCSVCEIQRFMQSHYTNKHGSFHSASAIMSVLTTPVVCGYIRFKDTYVRGQHDAIITKERFDKVQKIKAKRGEGLTASQKNPFKRTSLLGGLLWCGNCGARYYIKTCNSGRGANKKLIAYYTCYSRGKSSKRMIVDPACKNIALRKEKLDSLIIEQILSLQLEPDTIDDIPDNTDNTKEINKKLKLLNKQIEKAMDLYTLGNVPLDKISDRITKINQEIEKLENEKLETPEPTISINDAKEKIKNASLIFEQGTFEEQVGLVHYLIDRIYIYNDRLEIHWNFE